MIKIFLLLIFFLNLLNADLYENERIINEMVKSYNPKNKIGTINYSEKQLDILCEDEYFSSNCEYILIYTENEMRKKRIIFLLEKLSKKLLIEKKSFLDLNKELIKYIEYNQQVNNLTTFCSSTLCSEKNISSDLEYFEDNLEKFLTNKISVKKINIKDINKLYKENYDLLKSFESDEYKVILEDFIKIDKMFKTHIFSIERILSENDKIYKNRWLDFVYLHRYNYLIQWKEFFEEEKKLSQQ